MKRVEKGEEWKNMNKIFAHILINLNKYSFNNRITFSCLDEFHFNSLY